MPNQPKTPNRVIRIPDDLWALVEKRAERDGRTKSDVVRAALERYVKQHS
jgi:predicted DNA-binding protein